MSVRHVYMPMRPAEGVGSSRAGVTGSCEHLCEFMCTLCTQVPVEARAPELLEQELWADVSCLMWC